MPLIFDHVQTALGPVTALVVVHNYEPESSGGLFDVTPAEFDLSMAINPRATLFLRLGVRPAGTGAQGRGRIVTFTSGLPLKGEIAYAASKGAIDGSPSQRQQSLHPSASQ